MLINSCDYKIEKQYSDNYCGQLLKLLKIILRDAEKSGLEVRAYLILVKSIYFFNTT